MRHPTLQEFMDHLESIAEYPGVRETPVVLHESDEHPGISYIGLAQVLDDLCRDIESRGLAT